MNSKELAKYLITQFESLEDIKSKAMMGGYIFYYKQKIFGGIYEPGFMFKVTKISQKYLPNAKLIPPYTGAKPLLVVEDVEDKFLLCKIVKEMYNELELPKKRKI